jgi:signal transduction histidine kinase
MLGQAPQVTKIDYVCIDADLLSEIRSDLQSLKRDNRRLTLTMAAAGHELRAGLHGLYGALELLTFSQDRSAREDLCQRVKAHIFQLALELEQLALQMELDCGCAATQGTGP